MGANFANSDDFLEHLNFALGEPTPRGLNTLVAAVPEPINTRKLLRGMQAAADEEYFNMKAAQGNPDYERQLHGWTYVDGVKPLPSNMAEYERAYELAESLSAKDVAKLIGGYGGERGEKPTGRAAIEMAADNLYSASYGFDLLTGAPHNYKQNAGHIYAFAQHGQGMTRPEQARVNKVTQDFDGREKLELIDDTIDDIGTAQLYADHPAEMEALLKELPSSNRESSGWNPELNRMRTNARRWEML